jgi:hypothetical protein
MSVVRAKCISDKINNSFWTTSSDPNTLIGIRLYNSDPFTNVEYPYQLQITFYSPGYSYFADTTQKLGGVSIYGYISYDNWMGELLNLDTILWNGRTLWTRIDKLPVQQQTQQNDPNAVYNFDNTFSGALHKKLSDTYGSYMGD